MSTPAQKPLVGVIMGSRSDWPTLSKAAETLAELGVPYETRVVSAHRTPDRLVAYAKTARERGLRIIIAGAGGAAGFGQNPAMPAYGLFPADQFVVTSGACPDCTALPQALWYFRDETIAVPKPGAPLAGFEPGGVEKAEQCQVALADDRLHALETVERPGEAGGGIESAGKQDNCGFHAKGRAA